MNEPCLSLQFNPGYVICSFIFLLIGLAAIASSINQLVLRFMMLSLEDDKVTLLKLRSDHRKLLASHQGSGRESMHPSKIYAKLVHRVNVNGRVGSF